MPTININGNIITKTAAQWALDTDVYTDQQVLVTSDVFYTGTDQPRFKFANGSDTWSNLDYVPEGGGGSDQITVSYFNVTNTALVDSTTYYIGQMTGMSTGLTSFARVPLPAGTLKEVHVNTWTTNTVGSEDSVLTLYTNDGADSYEIATDIKWNARNINRQFTGLNESITAGNSFLEMVTPVFATNPGNAQIRVNIIMEL